MDRKTKKRIVAKIKPFKEKLKGVFVSLLNELGEAIKIWIKEKEEDRKIIKEAVRKEKIKLRVEQKTAHMKQIYKQKQSMYSGNNNKSIFDEERKRDERWLN